MKAYQSDLTDQQWERLSRYLPQLPNRGRHLKWERRVLIDAILYVVYTGCQWRQLPHDFPPWQTVYYHFRKWQKDETLVPHPSGGFMLGCPDVKREKSRNQQAH